MYEFIDAIGSGGKQWACKMCEKEEGDKWFQVKLKKAEREGDNDKIERLKKVIEKRNQL